MIKKFIVLLLISLSSCAFAHTHKETEKLNLPHVIETAQSLPQEGIVKIYQRKRDGHEGQRGSEFLYLAISKQYLKKLYPMIEAALKEEYPDIKPDTNSLGLHISIYDKTPAAAKAYIGKQFSFTVTGVDLIKSEKTYSDTKHSFRRYFVICNVSAPLLTQTFEHIQPSYDLSNLHFTIAEWRPT